MPKPVSALFLAIVVSCLSLVSAWGAERSAAEHEPVKTGLAKKKSQEARSLTSPTEEGQLSPWYFFLGLSNAYPKMGSESLVRNYYDGLMHKFSPTFDDVLTVGDIRDMGLLWVPYVGVGRTFGDKWSVFGQLGYSAGKVRTKADDKSYLILPMHTDFEIKRGAFYVGLGADYFPWGMPELKEYHGIMERLRAARPNIGGRATYVSATYRAKAKVGWKPFDNLVDMTISDEWVIPSVAPSIGLDVPLGPKSQLSFGASYSWFKEQEDDFNGPAFTIIWKRHFSAKKK
ncbi:MAG: hypothetical protein K1Y02_07020 [Candidatus Hydrogenedentes bacterium]|nr:hypothetical protein [Candidatus Hydrogenedentota bacterium]